MKQKLGVWKLPSFFSLSPLPFGVVVGVGVGFGVGVGVGPVLRVINKMVKIIMAVAILLSKRFLFYCFLLPLKLSIAAVLCTDAIVIRLNISVTQGLAGFRQAQQNPSALVVFTIENGIYQLQLCW